VFASALLVELEHPSRRREAALALAVAAGGLTHYFFAFSVVAVVVWLVVDRSLGAPRLRALGAIAAGSIAPLAWAPVMLSQYRADRFWWIGPFALRHVVAVPLRLASSAFIGSSTGTALSWATLAAVVAGAVQLGRKGPLPRGVGALALGPLVLAGCAWAAGARVFALRNLIEIGPFVAVAFAGALAALPRRTAVLAAATAAVAVVASLAVSDVPGIPPYNVMARALARQGWGPGDPVVVYGNVFSYRAPLEWYLPHQPTLDISRPLPVHCAVVYVIRPHTFTVERLRVRRPLTAIPRFRGATLLTDAHRRLRCAQPLRSRRFAPLA
jgi:hypothetical protein